MTPERWQQINDLYHSSLQREAFERAAFIAEACSGDEELRREVESLVASHEQADSFIEQPVFGAVARLLVADDADPMKGRGIGHYKVLSKLGSGGMGEVYLAQDTTLGRKVAIKLLPDRFTLEADRIRRFQQEARSASALNHPNILTIYEIGEVENRPYIATEFIDGRTLRHFISGGSLKLGEALEVAIQITGALQAAHEAGIVHRDIKPENIMIRSRDRIAKVLDFGLAKLAGQPAAKVATDSDASTIIETSAGMIMGTISYMSPEQARALPVDARTDIFSLGVVLYEMMAGRRPFDGATTSDTLVAILNEDPPALTTHWPDVPRELERIVTKSLEKDVADRYQTIDDMAVELRRLKQQLEAQESPELSAQLDWKGGGLIEEGNNSVTSKASRRRRTQGGKTRTLKTFSVQYLVSEIKEHKTGVMMAVGPLFLVILAAAYFLRSPAHQSINSLAIMPFSFSSSDPNIMADPDREYLSDGVTESLINDLSQLPQMKVIARSSVFHYKGQQADPKAVGQALGVEAILTGRIVQRGDTLTISVELINAEDNSHIWGKQYDRKASDLSGMQRDIAKQITDQLRLKLTGEEQKQLNKPSTENAEAYQLYLKGRYYWNKRTKEGFNIAIEYFQQAIDKDPNYALAYTGLADTYNLIADYRFVPPHEVLPKAKVAALKALEIDGTLAEAHTSLASVHAYDWNWADVEGEYRRAIELNPNYATSHHWFGIFLAMRRGRIDEGIAEIKRAQELDPLSLIISADLGFVLYHSRQYDQAIEQCRKTIEMDPNFAKAHDYLSMFYDAKGMYEEAIVEFQTWRTLSFGNQDIQAGMAAELREAYRSSGARGYWQKRLDWANEASKRTYVPSFQMARFYARLGDKERTFEFLEKSYQAHEVQMPNIRTLPDFDDLRSDPRFADLLRRMKLE